MALTSGGSAHVRTTACGIGVVAFFALLVLGLCASTASAADLTMDFTEARASVGEEQLVDAALFEKPATARFTAEIDPLTGDITDGEMTVPDFSTHITHPINADVTVAFDIGEIEGHFNRATGALSLSGTAAGTLTSGENSCTVTAVTDDLVLTLDTAAAATRHGSPRAGAPFPAGLAGDGAIGGAWEDMAAEPVSPEDASFCNNVYDYIGGEGGIWLDHEDLVAPTAPQLTATDPVSPGASGSPLIRGVAEAGSTVKIYVGSTCTGTPVATGTAAQLASPGIAVSVAEGATVSFVASATDAAGHISACSAAIVYTRTVDTTKPDGDKKDPVVNPDNKAAKAACAQAKRDQVRFKKAVKQAKKKVNRLQNRAKRAKSKRQAKRLRTAARNWRGAVKRRQKILRKSPKRIKLVCSRVQS